MTRKERAFKDLYKVGTAFVYTEELYEKLSKYYEIEQVKGNIYRTVAERGKND